MNRRLFRFVGSLRHILGEVRRERLDETRAHLPWDEHILFAHDQEIARPLSFASRKPG